jgi:hypothetical protein
VSSASDVGEFEVEQFYVDRRLNDAMTLRAGLFLMPFGLLNEHHEPTNFYGVQRNFVETMIIPSTWFQSLRSGVGPEFLMRGLNRLRLGGLRQCAGDGDPHQQGGAA